MLHAAWAEWTESCGDITINQSTSSNRLNEAPLQPLAEKGNENSLLSQLQSLHWTPKSTQKGTQIIQDQLSQLHVTWHRSNSNSCNYRINFKFKKLVDFINIITTWFIDSLKKNMKRYWRIRSAMSKGKGGRNFKN